MSSSGQGWLVLADISGYTKFFSQADDPARAQEVIEGLLASVLRHVRAPMRLVKIEGDAVFSIAEGAEIADAKSMLAALVDCYHDFRVQLDLVGYGATAPGTTCQPVSGLDLKFVLHRGSWLSQDLGGVDDVVGPDVILAHRLLKNSVVSTTGVKAYVLSTAAAAEGLAGAELLPHREQVDGLGEVDCQVLDLHPVYAEMRDAGAQSVRPEDADVALSYELDCTPAEAWDWHATPGLRERWDDVDGWRLVPDPSGRFKVGTTGYCSHSGVDQPVVVLEWAPFRRFTFETVAIREGIKFLPQVRGTLQFTSLEGGGTRVDNTVKVMTGGFFGWLFRFLLRSLKGTGDDGRIGRLRRSIEARRSEA